MKYLLLVALVLAAGSAQAQNISPEAQQDAEFNSAQGVCERTAREFPLPAYLREKVVVGQADKARAVAFTDTALVTQAEAADLVRWRDGTLPCTQAMLGWLAVYSPRVENLRRTLARDNELILGDLIARRISYGVANRRFVDAAFAFNRAQGLIARPGLGDTMLPPVTPPPGLAPIPGAGNAADNATVQRLLDEAIQARDDAARPVLCPSNPSGLAGPAPDPVTMPFC